MPNPPSGEQTRLYVWRCPECDFWMKAHDGGVVGVCFCTRQEVQMERIEVVPASDLAALQAELDEVRSLRPTSVQVAALQSDLRIARERRERADKERVRQLREVLTDTRAYLELDSAKAARYIEARLAALQQLEAGQEQQ